MYPTNTTSTLPRCIPPITGDKAGFLKTLKAIYTAKCPTSAHPLFRYGIDTATAAHNESVLERYD